MVGSGCQIWFLKGSRILLPRRRLWKTGQTPQRGLRKPQSPEQTHQVREVAGPSEGTQVGAGGRRVGNGSRSGRQGSWWGVSPGPIPQSLFVLHLPLAVTHPLFILDRDSPPCPDGIAKENHAPAPEPESCEASEPPAKRSKR